MPALGPQELLLMVGIVVIGGLGTLFWVWMLVDCLQSRAFDDQAKRIQWAVGIALTHVVGAAVYFFCRRGGRPHGSVAGLASPHESSSAEG